MKRFFISALTAANLLLTPGLFSKEPDLAEEQVLPSFSKLADAAEPATVTIKAQIIPQYAEQQDPFAPFRHNDFFRQFFGGRPEFFDQKPEPQLAGGSGFIVSKDGYIVTNHHVVKDASQITVLLTDGREFPATVKGSDARTDIAVLKIEETNLPYLNFGNSDSLKKGEWVVAIGAPFGLEAILTAGTVSGRHNLGITAIEDSILTTAAINQGNSGGPLLNLKGEVVGINSAIITRTGGWMGLGCAISSNIARAIVERIMNDGTIKRAYLGITMQPLDQALAEAWDLEKTEGVLITEVVKDSAAEKGGIQQGDIILEYNGKPIKNQKKLQTEIALMEPGDTLRLKLLRNKKILALAIPLGSQDNAEFVTTDLIKQLGIEVENLTQELAGKLNLSSPEGVLISQVKPGSPAARAKLKPSLLIIGVATNPSEPRKVRNLADFNAALKELKDRKHIILIVRQDHYQQYFTIKLN